MTLESNIDSPNVVYYPFKAPLSAQLELTNDCFLHCIQCYNSWNCPSDITPNSEIKHRKNSLDRDGFYKVIDSLGKSNLFELVFTGGEPLLKKDILYDLAERARSYGIETRLNSNLVRLEDSDVEKIKQTGIKSVLGSLSSYKKDTHNKITVSNSYDNILKSIGMLKDAGINIGMNMVVMSHNKNDVYETGKFLFEKFGINAFCATPIGFTSLQHVPLGLTREETVDVLDSLLRINQEFGINVDVLEPIPICLVEDINKYRSFLRRDCSAGKTTVAIGDTGDVRPCTHVSKSYGNLLEESLEEIWSKMGDWRNSSFLPRKCSSCSALELCSTGCRESARVVHGSYSEDDPYTDNLGPLEKRIDFETNTFSIPSEKPFRVVRDLRHREENGNYVLFSPKKHMALLVTKSSFDIIRNLYKEDFTLGSLGGDDITRTIMGHLEKRGIIEEID